MQAQSVVPLVVVVLAAAPLHSQSPDGTESAWEQRFRRGKAALAQGDAALAAREFQAVLSYQPALLPAQVNLGLAYHLMGDYTRAVQSLTAARRQSHEIGGANLVLGGDALTLGRASDAIPPLEDAVAESPDHRARETLCQAYAMAERFAKAVPCLASLYGAQPADAEGWYGLGTAYLDLARIATLRMRLRFDDTAWSKRLAGDSFAQRGDWEQAAQLYRQAAAKAGRLPEFHVLMGIALLRSGDATGAAHEFQSELEIAPDSPYARCGLAELEEQRGQNSNGGKSDGRCIPVSAGAGAHLDLNQAADAGRLLSAADLPGHPDPRLTYWMVKAFLAGADECFNELLARDTESWLAHRLRAEYDEIREDPGGAAAEYRAAVDLHPASASLRAAYAALLLRQGLTSEAEAQVRAALKIAPESAALYMLAGRIASREGNLRDAIAFLSESVRRQPSLLAAHALLGEALWKNGSARDAARELTRAESLDFYGNLHYLLFKIYRELGMAEQARVALARSQEIRGSRQQDDIQKVIAGKLNGDQLDLIGQAP